MIRYLKKVCEPLKKNRTSSGQTHPKDKEFMGRHPILASNGVVRRFGQTGSGRAPRGTFSRRQQLRGPPNNNRTELDGTYLGLSIERDIAE